MIGQTSTSYSNWSDGELGKMVEPSKSQWKPGDKDQRYIGLEHINVGELSINGFGISSKLASNKFYFEKGDILFGKLRPYFRKVWKAKFDGVCSTDIWVLKAKKGFDQNFIFYLVANPVFIDKTMGANIGTHMPRADWGFLKNTIWNVPQIEEQQAIAAVLSSLDDKIELLREQNLTLEATAQAIFKEWFVNFNFPGSTGKMIDSELGKIPEGWNVGSLKELGGEITDYVANGSFASLKENVTLYDTPNYALFLRNTDLKSDFSQKLYVDEHSYNFLKKTQLHGGEIIISNVGDVGSVYLCPFLSIPMILGNNTISLKSEYQSYFYSLFTNRVGQFLINTITGGSAQPKFNKTDFRNMRIVIPEENILNRFETIAWSLYSKILKNKAHIQSLSEMRDMILPKLMKGDLRVKGFDN